MNPILARSSVLTAAALVLASSFAGCTTSLSSEKVDNFSQSTSGQVYYLPRVEFQVMVSREIKTCSVNFDSEANAVSTWMREQLRQVEKQETPAASSAFVKSILNDDALKSDEVVQKLNLLLGAGWQQKILSGTSAKSKSNLRSPTTSATLNSEALATAITGLADIPEVKKMVKFEATLTSQATPTWAIDTAHAYSLKYDKMQNGLKGTDYAVESYPNGTLKSVNITIDDQTGPAILSALSGIAKIAAATGGFPLPALGANAQGAKSLPFQSFLAWKESFNPCKAEIRLKAYQRAALDAQVESNSESLLAQQKKIDAVGKDQVKALAAVEKAKADLKDTDAADAEKVTAAKAAVAKADLDAKELSKSIRAAKVALAESQDAAGKVTTRISSLRKALTFVNTTTFQPTGESRSMPMGGEDDAIKAWMSPEKTMTCGVQYKDCEDIRDFRSKISAYIAIHAPSVPKAGRPEEGKDAKNGDTTKESSASTGGKQTAARKSDEANGIFYRQPLKAVLVVCTEMECLSSGKSLQSIADKTLLNTSVDVPQLGALAFLNLYNTTFQNNTIGASFAESGALTKVTYKSNAAVAKAAEVFDASADTVLKFKDAKRLQESTKLDVSASELDSRKKLVDAQLALEKAQADLDAFRDSQKKGDD